MSNRRTFGRQLAMSIGGVIFLSVLGSTVARADDDDDDQDVADADPLQPGFDQLGKPYIWASAAGRSYFGANPVGFDCSGFVAWVARQNGTYMPAQTSSAWSVSLPTNNPQRGDLAFWGMRYASPRLQHVAIYLDDGQVLQCGGRHANVNIDSAYAIGTPSFRRLMT